MYKYISNHKSIDKTKIGPKSLNLITLVENKINVPDFVLIGSSIISKLVPIDLINIAKELDQYFKEYPLIIRSSGLNEDSDLSSMAGKYKSIVCSTKNEIPRAIELVISDAEEKSSLENFSLIIQKFIVPEISGIGFSRDPNGERNFVIEYHKGLGEEIVGGKIKPKMIRGYWNSLHCYKLNNWQKSLLDDIYKIEKIFNKPQDLEFVVYKETLSIVQSRPITTLTSEQFESHKEIDAALPRDKPFKYKLNDISNTIESISNINLAILMLIYPDHGSMSKAYRKLGIKYNYKNYLKKIGDKLYTDLSLEKKSIYPSTQLLFGLPITLWNYIKLSSLKLSTNQVSETLKNFELLLNWDLANIDSADKWAKKFMKIYVEVCRINIILNKSLNYLELVCKKNNLNYVDYLNYSDLPQINIDTKKFIGNSLDYFDRSEFHKPEPNSKILTEDENIAKLPKYKVNILQKSILNASNLIQLREYGRWIEVKYISKLRSILEQFTDDDINSISTHSWLKLFNGTLDIKKIKIETNKNSKESRITDYPVILQHKVEMETNKPRMIVKGDATGNLILFEDLKLKKSPDPSIIYNETLDIGLAEYFSTIIAIISSAGGELSHLAILAREKGIPVLVGVRKSEISELFGRKVVLSDIFKSKPQDK